MTGSKAKGKSQGRFILDEEQGRQHGSTEHPTKPEKEKLSRGSSNGWTTSDAEDGSLTAAGQHDDNTTSAPQPKGEAAVVPAVGGGSSPEEHNKVEDQRTLREQLETLVSHKLRTLGDLDHAGLAALEALNKLPAAPREQPPASDGVKKKILPLGLEKIKKFSGKDPHYLTDCLNQFYSLVVAALPASSPASVNRALNRDVIFVLEGSALKFFNSLKAGHVQWEATPPVPDDGAQGGSSSSQQQQQQEEDGRGGKHFRPPSTWPELYEAFHDHYLPVTGIARTSEKLFSSTQAPDESVLSLAQRQLGLATHLHRLIEANGKQIDFMEAISIRLFERALRIDLRRIQDAEPPCSSFQESVDRAERNAIKLAAKKPDSTTAPQENIGGSGASGDPVVLPIARSAVEDGGGGGGGGVVFSGAIPNHAQKSRHDGSGRDGREERSSPTAPQGNDAVRSGRDAGDEAGEVLPPDDGSQSAATWQEEPAGGGGEGPGFEKRLKKKARKGKRTRDWPEMHHGGDGAGQPFPSPQHEWVDHHGGGGGGQPFPSPQRPRVDHRGGGGTSQPFPLPQRPRVDHRYGGGGAGQPFPPPQRPRGDPGSIPPCKVKGCRTINRNFHCSNECFFHPIFGERNKARKGIRRGKPDNRGPQQHHNDGFGGQ